MVKAQMANSWRFFRPSLKLKGYGSVRMMVEDGVTRIKE